MSDDSSLHLVSQPQDYFRELVTQALGKLRLQVQPETEFYLVNLLNHFMTTDNLYVRDGGGQLDARPLALLLKDAVEEAQSHNRMLMFRQVGDVSLYTAGYFGESLDRKAVDLDYYIDLGGVAYSQVAAYTSESHLRHMYGELSEKFPHCVEVLAQISEQTQPKSKESLLRLYERWQQTQSPRAAKSLEEAGILPSAHTKRRGNKM